MAEAIHTEPVHTLNPPAMQVHEISGLTDAAERVSEFRRGGHAQRVLVKEVVNNEPALLAAIRATPRDDTAPLVYADWLEEHDRSDRSALIRTQIARARESNPLERVVLRAREQRLLAGPIAGWIGTVGDLTPVQHTTIERVDSRPENYHGGWVDRNHGAFDCDFVRGIVGFVRGSWASWRKHADAIRQAHPVELVGFTDVPNPTEFRKLLRKTPAGRDECEKVDEWFARENARQLDNLYCEYLKRLAESIWKGVTFDVPVAFPIVVAR